MLFTIKFCLVKVDAYDTDAIAINKLCKLVKLSCTQLYVSSRVNRPCFSLNGVLLDFSLLILPLNEFYKLNFYQFMMS